MTVHSYILLSQTLKMIFLIISITLKIIVRYKKIGYNLDVLRQTTYLGVNLFKVNSFAYLFNCTTVGRASDCTILNLTYE